MVVMAHHGKWPRRILRVWQQYEAMSLVITFNHPDDTSESEWEIRLPHWPWHWVCWLSGHADSTYGYCLVCRKGLPRWGLSR